MSSSLPLSLSEGASADARRATIDQQEHLAAVLRAPGVRVQRRRMVLDLRAVTFVEPSPFGYFLALRVAVTVAIALSSATLYLRPKVTPGQLQALDLLLHVFVCVLVARMALRYRGLASPYAHGISCILVARGITLSDRWQRAIALMGIPARVYPVTLVIAAPFTPLVARLQHSPEAPSARLGRAVSEALEAVVMKCLAREPAERYASAQAALEALDQSGERPSRRSLWSTGARASRP